MNFFASFIIAFLTASYAFAQSINIGSPVSGSTVKPGQSLAVEVDRPDTLTGSTEVAIVIALSSCSSGTCQSPQNVMGTILYNGPYAPKFQTTHAATPGNPPYQNFTVTIPSSTSAGKAILSVTHLNLVGAGPFPLLEFKNVTLSIV